MAEFMKNGEPLRITSFPYIVTIFCCDCNLCHLHLIDKVGKDIIITSYRDDYLTDKERVKCRKKKKAK